MKKTLMVLIVLFSLFIVPNFKVNALTDSFYVKEYLNSEYIVKIKGQTGKYEQMRAFRRKSDNRIAYCLELWEGINENKTLTGYDDEQYNHANIDYSSWEKVMLISYYGYGYQNHTEQKWIAITQFMIWKTLSPDSTLYFTDTLNGKKINKYEQEMAEINNLIKNHATIPSFDNQTFNTRYKEDYQIIDDNNILDKYDITGYNTNKVSKVNNTLTVATTEIGENIVILANSGKNYNNNPTVYIDPAGQDLLIPGNYIPIYSVVRFNLPEGNITVTKLDKDTNTKLPQGNASLNNSKFILMDKDNMIVSTKTITNNSELTFEHLGYGTYYLKEIESGKGYLLNDNVIKIEVNNNYENINFYNQVIKEKIIIKKYIRNTITNQIAIEEGAIFSIYNSNNEKITTFKTDENGVYELTLPYGDYLLKQDYGMINHSYIKDILISINNNGNTQYLNLYNDELTAKVKVINTDSDSNLPILESGASFKIKKLDGDIETLITNSNGFTNELLLSSGKYQLEQISSVDGYDINKNIFEFEITADTNFINDNGNNLIELTVPNDKLKGKIKVIKKTEYYLNDILTDTKIEELNDITIYANDDIYSKDEIKLYEKNNIVTSNLYFGTYYLINPVTNAKIELIIDTPSTRKVEIIEKIYEYETKDKEESDPIKSDYEEIITNVPNTYQKETISYLSSLLILTGFILNKMEKKHETHK